MLSRLSSFRFLARALLDQVPGVVAASSLLPEDCEVTTGSNGILTIRRKVVADSILPQCILILAFQTCMVLILIWFAGLGAWPIWILALLFQLMVARLVWRVAWECRHATLLTLDTKQARILQRTGMGALAKETSFDRRELHVHLCELRDMWNHEAAKITVIVITPSMVLRVKNYPNDQPLKEVYSDVSKLFGEPVVVSRSRILVANPRLWSL